MSGGRAFSRFLSSFLVNRRSQGVGGRDLVILCFDRQCPEQNTVVRLKSKYLAQKNFGSATPLLVTIFIPMACISLPHSHVSQYQAFDTALSYLMFILLLQKARNNANIGVPRGHGLFKFLACCHFAFWKYSPPHQFCAAERMTAHTAKLRRKAGLSFLYYAANNIMVFSLCW